MGRPFRLEASACILGAAMLLVLPLKWLAAAVIAAGIHELCHYAALRLLGVEVLGVSVGGRGVIMQTGQMLPWQNCICALAGPAGGLLLLPFAKWIPRVAVIALVHSVYNLLPLFPLDGGRALRCFAGMLFREGTANKICRSAEIICTAAIVTVGIYGLVRLKMVLGLVIAVYIVWKAIGNRKQQSQVVRL